MDQKSPLGEAKDILLHPNFSKLTPQGIQDAYRLILNSGVAKEEIINILTSASKEITYIESLDYNVFLTLVQKLEGKDVIRFCNSSPLINEKCNRDFNAEGKIIPQYMFVLLLQKMKVNLNAFRQYKPDVSPREVYTYLTIGDGVRFNQLHRKLENLKQLFSQFESSFHFQIPKDLYALLYSGDEYDPNFLHTIEMYDYNNAQKNIDNLLAQHAGFVLHELLMAEENEISENDLMDLEFLERKTGLSADDLIDEELYDGFKAFPPRGNASYLDLTSRILSKVQLVNIVRNYAENTRKFLLSQMGKSKFTDDQLREMIKRAYQQLLDVLLEEKDFPTELLDSVKLDDRDIEYLLRLHKRILTGDLKINTPFKLEALI